MRSIIISIILVFLLTSSAGAKPDEFKELGVKGYDLVWDMKFDEANKIFDEMIKKEPDNALGYLLKARGYALIYYFVSDEKEYKEKYEELSLKAIDIAEDMLKKDKDDIDALFYLGGTYGYLGLYYAEENSVFKALRYGKKGVKYLEQVIDKDPEYYDAYFGVGLYHYLVGTLPETARKVISFFLGVEGDKKKGLDEILKAVSKGSYLRDETSFMLATKIYIESENRFFDAADILESLINKYPENNFARSYLSVSYRNAQRYDLSIKTLETALQSKTIDKYPFLHSRLHNNLGRAYSNMNEHDQAIPAFKRAIEISQSKNSKQLRWVYAWSQYLLGFSYEMKGALDTAMEHYLKVEKKDDKYVYGLAQKKVEGLNR